jgi:hypothetical protein
MELLKNSMDQSAAARASATRKVRSSRGQKKSFAQNVLVVVIASAWIGRTVVALATSLIWVKGRKSKTSLFTLLDQPLQAESLKGYFYRLKINFSSAI